jgi:hypothetical protein
MSGDHEANDKLDGRDAPGRTPQGEPDPGYRGLRALEGKSFPKRCANCGRIFVTVEDFVRETRPAGIGGRGFKKGVGEDGSVIVELFRNCPCGSTLMDSFADRRRGPRRTAQVPARAAPDDRRGAPSGGPPHRDAE